MRQYKNIIIFFLVIFVKTAAAEPLDKIIAVVNSEPITQVELQQQKAIAKAQMESAGVALPPAAKLNKMVLDKLIDIKLQLQLAQKSNIKISPQELDDTISKIAAKNNMTLAQLQQGISQHGLSYSGYRNQIRQEMLLARLEQSQIAPQIKFSPEELKGLNEAQKQRLFQKKYRSIRETWLSGLRSQAYIKFFNDSPAQ